MSPAISSEKKAAIATRKKYKASTRPAIVDARSGNNGVPDHIWGGYIPGLQSLFKMRRLNAELAEHAEESSEHFFSAVCAVSALNAICPQSLWDSGFGVRIRCFSLRTIIRMNVPSARTVAAPATRNARITIRP